jgi:hypothetical protein
MNDFDPTCYGAGVARLLAMDGNGSRLMPLTCDECSSAGARQILRDANARELFPSAADPVAAMAGLSLYFSCFEEAHELVSKSESRDCELWHAILHRQEPDAGNAAYWFRKVGPHQAYSKIAQAAVRVLEKLPRAEFRAGKWDPFAFIAFCERARSQPGSAQEQAAREIQRAEWQIVFDHCARGAQSRPAQ